MSAIAEVMTAWVAVGLALDGVRKLRDAGAFTRWLTSGNLGFLARRQVVLALGLLEITLGAAAVWPAGQVAALCGVLLVTPLGAVLVRRTGVCACRGVVRSRTPLDLVVRNGILVALLAGSALLHPGPIGAWAVVVVAGGWCAAELYALLVLRRAPLVLPDPAEGPLRTEVAA